MFKRVLPTFTRRARRFTSTLASDPEKIRNIALVAHIDSGKTTLTESILLKSSYISSSGSVDTGSTTTDFLPAERERGITIQSASIPVKWKDWTFNLIDTPGHSDFGMEVESASRVVDGAVVLIDSVEGVEGQTKGVWKQLDRYGVPTRIIFLNKLDRPGASFRSSLLSLLSHRLHPHPLPLSIPIASFNTADYQQAEPGIQGVVDLVNWEVWKWDSEGNITRHMLPRNVDGLSKLPYIPSDHPIIQHLIPARNAMLEGLAMFSEELMDTLVALPEEPASYLTVQAPEIMKHLRSATMRNDVLPVLCGSAMKNVGTELLMDYVGELLANPLDVQHEIQSGDAPLHLLAWKVGWDKRKGWMTFVRVYSGTLTRQTNLFNASQNQKERVSKLLLLYANQPEEVDQLSFGQVGVILGLRYTRTGDTLTTVGANGPKPSKHPKHPKAPGVEGPKSFSMRSIVPPPAVIAASVIPQSHAELDPVQQALESLARTDPSVRIDLQDGQILVHGLGALHLEIVEGRLRDEWGVRFEFGRRRVSYREGLDPGRSASVPNRDLWRSEHGDVTVVLKIRPLLETEIGNPYWDGNCVVDADGDPYTLPEAHEPSPEGFIANGIFNTLSNSPHTSLALTHVHVQVKSFHCAASSFAPALTAASAVILRRHIQALPIGPVMEPFIRLKVDMPEDSLGKIVKDITEHGGEVLDLGTSSAVFTASDGSEDEDVGSYSEDNAPYVPPDWLSPSSAGSSKSTKSAVRQKRTVHAMAPLSQMLDYSQRLRALSGGHGTFEMANAGFRQVSPARKMEILKEIGRA